jgi:hypothetical protein
LPNAVHIYLQELTAKQTTGLSASHITPHGATNFFLMFRNVSILLYFFHLLYQTEDWRKVEEKYERQGKVHVERVKDNRLPAKEYRPQRRRNEGISARR